MTDAPRLEQLAAAEVGTLMFFQSPNLVCLVGADGYLRQINESWTRSLGLRQEQVLGRPFVELVHQEDRDATRRGFEALWTSDVPLTEFDSRCLCADGSFRWFLWGARRLGDGETILAVGRDITRRKATEQSLQAAEARATALLEATPDGIVTTDEVGTIESFNAAAERIFGYQSEEVIGKSIALIIPAAGYGIPSERVADHLREGIRESLGKAVEVEGRRKDGSLFPLDVTASEVLINGRLVFTGVVRDVTVVRQAEEAQRESENRLRLLFESSPLGIIVSPIEGIVEQANPAMTRMLGADITGHKLSEYSVPALDPHISGTSLTVLQRGEQTTASYERVLRRSDGTPIWVQIIAGGIRDKDGEIRRVVRILADITENKRAMEERERMEATLRENEARLRAVLDTTLDGIVTVRNDGAIESFNAGAASLFGYTPEEIIGHNVNELVPAALRSEEGIPEYLHADGHPVRELTAQRKDGSLFPVELSSNRFQLDGETMFTGVIRDITERRKMERERAAAERKYRDIFDSAVEGIYQIAPDGTFLTANPALAAIYGYETARHLVESVEDIGRDLYVDPIRWQALIRVIDRKGAVAGFESEVRRADGTTIWISESVHAVFEGNGQIVRYEGSVQDITERKQMERQLIEGRQNLQQAYGDLREVAKLKDNFLSTVSHELRTPLTSIKGFAEILLSYEGLDKTTHDEFVEIINTESDRLIRLINDVLDLSRMEAGRARWKDEVLSIKDVIDLSTTATHPLNRSKGQTVKVRVPRSTAKVYADRDKLVQVVTNLLSNAFKFSPNDSEIVVAAGNGDEDGLNAGTVWVSVQDEGVGIGNGELTNIFEKFKQAGDTLTDKPKGTGLGLPICKEIVEHYGGRIWAESELDLGSTFTFVLPAVKPKHILARATDYNETPRQL